MSLGPLQVVWWGWRSLRFHLWTYPRRDMPSRAVYGVMFYGLDLGVIEFRWFPRRAF